MAAINRNQERENTVPLLEVRNLSRHFGGVKAVDGLSFKMYPGETVGIIGPNGSGKTTSFNLISGLLKPNSGQILFEGKPINGLQAERIAELGLVRTFQNGRVFGNMSVLDNVLVGSHTRLKAARPLEKWRHIPLLKWIPLLAELGTALLPLPEVKEERKQLEAEARDRLSLFGERLLPRQDKLAHTLSYANRRRTEIARALALNPRLLLLDEPTAGMNPSETAEVLDQLQVLRSQGYSLLLIEHKLDLVMQLSDHIMVMDNGKLLTEGNAQEVQTDERVIEAYLGRAYARQSQPEEVVIHAGNNS